MRPTPTPTKETVSEETLSISKPTQPEENQNISSHYSTVPADLIPILKLETELTENNTVSKMKVQLITLMIKATLF